MKEKNLNKENKCEQFVLTKDQFKQLIQNKLDRALAQLEARKQIPKSILAD